MSIIGLDIGGTKIFGARFDASFNMEDHMQVPTEADSSQETTLSNIKEVINHLMNDQVTGIGIAVAGFLKAETGVIMTSPNIPCLNGFHLKEFLLQEYHVDVRMENDARLMTLAETRLGAAKGAKNVLGLIFGTGIGGGVVLNGTLQTGSQGFAGEIGHSLSFTEGEIEDHLAGQGLVELVNKEFGTHYDSPTAIEHDLTSRSDIASFLVKKLLPFLYNLSLTVNPEIIVFAGGIGTHLYAMLEQQFEQELAELAAKQDFPLSFDIRISTLKNSGSLGAALLFE